MKVITKELIIQGIRQLRAEVADLKDGQSEMRSELRAIRGHMLASQADINNLCTSAAGLDTRLARVERRLNLSDTPQ